MIKKYSIFIASALILALVAGYFLLGSKGGQLSLKGGLEEQPLPEFHLKALPSMKCGVSTEELKGKVSLINIFASWCGSCRLNHTMLQKIAKEQDIPLYGINLRDSPLDAQVMLAQHGNPFTCVGMDLSGEVTSKFGAVGIPATYVVDKQGVIRFKQMGVVTQDTYNNVIIPLLKEIK